MSLRVLRLSVFLVTLLFVTLVGAVAWWLVNPTDKYLHPLSLVLEQEADGDWIVTTTREMPHGDQWGAWDATLIVQREDGSFVCSHTSEPILYRAALGPVVRYAIAPWAVACLDAGPPMTFVMRRQVFLWGWLPLWPTTISAEVGVAGAWLAPPAGPKEIEP